MLSKLLQTWTSTLALAASAVVLAGAGLALVTILPAAPLLVSGGLLVGSLACTGGAFAGLALRVRRLEMENMGLIEEISQEFDRVKDKLEIFGDALVEPTSIPVEDEANVPLRRVMVK